MALTTGKTYYPREKPSRGDWSEFVDDWEKDDKEDHTRHNWQHERKSDWEKNQYPSGGISFLLGRWSTEKFQSMNEYIKAFIKLAKEKMQKRPLIQSEPYEIFEEFTNNALKDIKQSLKQLTLSSPSKTITSFWMSGSQEEGRSRANKGTLSALKPWGFEDIRTEKQIKKLADEYLPQVKADLCGKARNFLGKEMAVIDFKADKYYKEIS